MAIDRGKIRTISNSLLILEIPDKLRIGEKYEELIAFLKEQGAWQLTRSVFNIKSLDEDELEKHLEFVDELDCVLIIPKVDGSAGARFFVKPQTHERLYAVAPSLGRDITLEEARAIAEIKGRDRWRDHIHTGQPVLAERHLEEAHAWMFFAHPKIELPERERVKQIAIVVGKRGQCTTTTNVSPDDDLCREELRIVSDIFAPAED